MDKILQVVIPMAGLGTRFSSYGFKQNKYLLPIDTNLTPMIEMAILSLGINVPAKYFFIINEEYGVDGNLRVILHDISYKHGFDYVITSVNKLTEGPACTVSHIEQFIDKTAPMLISNSDQVLSWSFDRFHAICKDPAYDGCLLTYTPNYRLILGEKDKHSFLRLDSAGNVVQCAEKIVLSDQALVGTHYIAVADDFFSAYRYMVEYNMRAPNGEFYISLVYQAMIEQGKRISYYDLTEDEVFYPVGEPQDYFDYLYHPNGGKYECEFLQPSGSIFQDGFSWYTKNQDASIVIKTYQEDGQDWNEIEEYGLFILLDGSAESWNHIENSWVSLNLYDISNSHRVRVKSNTRYAFIQHVDIEHCSHGRWNRSNFTRGWFLGNFEPSLYKTSDFEVGLLIHHADEKWDYHYHKEAEETNVLLKGKMKINEQLIEAGAVFQFPKNQIACPIFLEDCHILCIKEPCVIGDKYCI